MMKHQVQSLTAVSWREPGSVASTWLVLSVATILLATLFGSPPLFTGLYLTYQALFVALPGTVLLLISLKRKLQPVEFAAKAIVIGQCFEMLAGLCFSALRLELVYPILPFLYAAAGWLVRDRFISSFAPVTYGPAQLLICAVASIFLLFAASLFNFDPVVDQHYTWVGAFANAVTAGWPPTEPFLMNVPLHYHYLYNVHIGMAAGTMGIPIVLVAARLAIIFHSLSFILCLFAFSSARTGQGGWGVVAAVSILLTFGYSEVMWKIYHLATASIMYRVASTIVAFQIFLLLLDEILAPKNKRIGIWLLTMAIFVGSGTRAMLLPMLGAGVGLLLLTNLSNRAIAWDYAKLLLIVAACIIAGMVVFLGLGSGQSDGTKLILIQPLNLNVSEWATGKHSPVVETLLVWGCPPWLTSFAYLLIALCGRMTFLLPGVMYATCTAELDRGLKALLGGVAIGGVVLLVVVETVVPQEIWAFYWYADIALALMGALGLRAMWYAPRRGRVASILLLLSGLLFIAQATEFSAGFASKLTQTNFPTPTPTFQDPGLGDMARTLQKTINSGDVLVAGGNFGTFDERPLAASVPGLQLFASRYILSVYAKRTTVDPRVASRLWLLNNDLSSPFDRDKVKKDVDGNRSLYFLWIGQREPLDQRGLSRISSSNDWSLWKVE